MSHDDFTDGPTDSATDSTTDGKPSIDERLRRLGMAKDLQRAMAAGIGRLPVSDTTKSSLTSTSATAVAVVGETTVALAKGAVEAGKGAVTAAKEGTETFQRTRHEQATASYVVPEPVVDDRTDDVTTRLERLSRLHRDGHLDDVEYAEAKARVIAGE
ncbi:hypothetical protein [Cellulomonas xylanilytica]|uniref:SHOCT domain-containing protein n=1 Tax=Cellulomonas xylanilytica TaxID=233583 RepID=A0A510V2V0_9CELL|nr:hypothetical protein [Cellulomonas xylanilytica]GEK20181.1 hypothetical protein CXY01_07010 [Cellulomonas xylanilytica]